MQYGLKFRYTDLKLDFRDVLIVPRSTKVLSRSSVNLNKSLTFKTKPFTTHWTGIPIISSNMDTVTGLESFDKLRLQNYISCFPKHLNSDWLNTKDVIPELQYTDHYMLSCGVNKSDYETLVNLVKKLQDKNIKVKFICVDVANGYMSSLLDVCAYLRETFPQIVITAGNVVTPEGVQNLISHGVNIVKVGIGSGSVCTTRIKTGVGYPQLSAVLECADIAHKNGAYIISDGGIVQVGDIAKAFVAGADFVMLGSMLAGHSESPGELQLNPYDNEWYKTFYGMSSENAVQKYNGGMKNYRTAEGKSVKIKYKGLINNTLNDINGGLRSACTYVNANNLDELRNNGFFVHVNNTHNTSLGI
jgi:GMP reductase